MARVPSLDNSDKLPDKFMPDRLSAANITSAIERQSGVVLPEAHGAVGDGVTNDRVALQAALDAVATAGGGTVLLTGQYAWSGALTIKAGTWLVGSAANGASRRAELLAINNTSRLNVGVWAGSGADSYVGGIEKIRINGNHTGDPTGLVRFQCVAASVRSVEVFNPGGDGVVFDAAQNMSIDSLDIDASGDGGLVLTNGAGGLIFTRCEIRSNVVGLSVEDADGSVGNAYPYGPSHIKFSHCIFEVYQSVEALVRIDCGVIRFEDCGFSVNSDATVTDQTCVLVSNGAFPTIATYAEFVSCIWVGGESTNYSAIRVKGNNIVSVSGQSYFQNHTHVFQQDGGTGALRLTDTPTFSGGTSPLSLFETLNGGSTVGWSVDRYMGENFFLQPGLALVAWRTVGDNGARGFINANGLSLTDGTDFVAKVAYNYDQTNNLAALIGHHRVSNGWSMRPDGVVPNSASYALTINALAAPLFRIALVGSNNVGSMTVTNPQDGMLLTVEVTADALGHTVNWASNMRFLGGSPPPLSDPNEWTVVSFVYHGGTIDKWVETSRSTNLNSQQNNRYATSQTNTALPVPAGVRVVDIMTCGSGGGGGSGVSAAAGTARVGGGPGAGGSISRMKLRAADITGISTMYVTVGAGGTGGAAVTTSNTNGNAGSAGNPSHVLTSTSAPSATNTLCRALGGAGGAGGQVGAGGTGGAAGFGQFPGQAGSNASLTGAVGPDGQVSLGGAGASGGAGGGVSTGNTTSAGGASSHMVGAFTGTNPGGVGGGAGGGDGANGSNPPTFTPGQSGSGGGGNAFAGGAQSGHGGNGGRGSGGGGAGATTNGSVTGHGGDGGTGFVEVIFTF